MRGIGLLTLLGALLSTPPTAASQQFPYSAYVTGDDVYVRSGPGGTYYPTDKLQRGDRVEVYRHDPGGWHAIRPPQDSFSWVSARYVEATSDGLGRARDEQVAVRVGSRFSRVRDVIQVHLDRDELIEILEEHNAGGQTWYKVAPPAGEFRWIAGRFVSTERPDQEVVHAEPRGSVEASSPPPGAPPRSADAADDPSGDPAVDQQQPTQPPDGGPGQLQRWAPRRDRNPATQWNADRLRPPSSPPAGSDPGAAADSPPPPDQPTRTTADDPNPQPQEGGLGQQAELAEIERQLSAVVAEECTAWEFAELKEAAEILRDEAKTALERARVQRLLSKIARLEEIKRRNDRLRPTAPITALANTPSVAAQSPRTDELRQAASPGAARMARDRLASPQTTPPTGPLAARFDGVGTLRPVVTRRPGAPRYALVDRTGNVMSFVTPGPGVNLQPYLGREIGVRGTRGYIREYDRAHVMARRITALEGPMLR